MPPLLAVGLLYVSTLSRRSPLRTNLPPGYLAIEAGNFLEVTAAIAQTVLMNCREFHIEARSNQPSSSGGLPIGRKKGLTWPKKVSLGRLKRFHLAEKKNKRFHLAEKKQKVSLGRKKNKRFHLVEKKTKGFTWPKKDSGSLSRKILRIFVVWLGRFAPFAK